jgi:diguanylate cyclase
MRARRQDCFPSAIAGVTERLEKRNADRRLFDAVGAFLSEHMLEPSPGNYLLAYKLVTRSDAAFVAAIEEATSDGLRLSQRDADRILAAGAAAAEPTPPDSGAAMEEARRQLEAVAELVGATHAHAERYGRDLELTASRLRGVSIADPLENLLHITARMIERTKEAELQLSQTNGEVQSLRRELASISAEARTDSLTGLANRRALEDRFAWLQACRVTFSVAICDIDGFKAINDRHGHAVGDRVLKAVASVLESSSAGHLAARYGGEEFVLLLSGMTARAAAALVDAARGELASRRFRVRETDEEIGIVTFSAGVIEAQPGQAWLEAISGADEMLYRAKHGGRNRTEIAPLPASGGRG